MSAFSSSGYKFRYVPGVEPTSIYIRSQSSFSITKDFTLRDLKEAVNNATDETVWVKKANTDYKIGLSKWYAEAIISRLENGLEV